MARVEVFFLPFQGRGRFCVLHSPDRASTSAGAFVYVHPFAEEMNKSRRMAALQARALAAAGWFVLQIDLFGCGDSEGQFGDATWSRWVDDVMDASVWLCNRCGFVPMLWGMRLGCLLVAEAARRMQSSTDLLFWQPVHSGRQFLQQFLRLKLANQLFLGDDRERLRTEDLRGQLAQGEVIEIGGYALSPDLALGMDKSELSPPPISVRAAWFEIVATPELTPVTRSRVQVWQAAGIQVDVHAVAGPPFWQTQEISECPELIEATVDAVERWRK
ncbi:MAG TPA: hydrolase 2, exosortase A system-associated [Casimicrobiaceae bacterium]